MYKIILLFVAIIQACACFGKATSVPNDLFCEGADWVPFQDEKCFKLIKKYASREDAQALCIDQKLPAESEKPTLFSVKSEAEQRFLNEYLFQNSSVKVNVWLGAKRNSQNKFVWDDGELVGKFTNWISGSPTNDPERSCVEMQSKYSRKLDKSVDGVEGKWRDVTCELGNYVLCQKPQKWSLSKFLKLILETRAELGETRSDLGDTKKELARSNAELVKTNEKLSQAETELALTKERLANAETQLENTKIQLNNAESRIGVTENKIGAAENGLAVSNNRILATENQLQNTSNQLENLKRNPVPIGFIYAQLPNQPEPKFLWPWPVDWKDVSSEYAGLFFRAVGGRAGSFGGVQDENAPRITQVHHTTSNVWDEIIQLPIDRWSSGNGVFAGSYPGNTYHVHKFYTTGGEVRPRNTAIKIWKRVK